MAAGPVNQAQLQAHFQQPGQVYSDSETEACLQVLATQIDDNWTNQAALNDAVNGLVVGSQVIQQKLNLFRQALINGNFDIWQRGSNSNFIFSVLAAGEYTADRWKAYRTGSIGGMVVNRKADSGIPTANYVAEVGRTSGNASTAVINFGQALPTEDSVMFRGQQLTLTFSAKYMADFSASGKVVTAAVYYGTGTDQDIIPPITSQTVIASAGFTLTTSFQTFTLTTSAVPTNATQLFVIFSYTPTGTAGANDYFRLGQVQLCAGTVALPFQPKRVSEELQDCQRYMYLIETNVLGATIGQGSASAANTAKILVPLPVKMRAIPTVTIGATVWRLNDGVTETATTAITASATESTPTMSVLNVTTGGGLTQFRPYRMYSDNIHRSVEIDAEFT